MTYAGVKVYTKDVNFELTAPEIPKNETLNILFDTVSEKNLKIES